MDAPCTFSLQGQLGLSVSDYIITIYRCSYLHVKEAELSHWPGNSSTSNLSLYILQFATSKSANYTVIRCTALSNANLWNTRLQVIFSTPFKRMHFQRIQFPPFAPSINCNFNLLQFRPHFKSLRLER